MAKVSFEGAKWFQTIRKATRQPQKLELEVTLVTDARSWEYILKVLADENFMREVLETYVEKEFLGSGTGILYQQFHERANAGEEYWPHFIRQKETPHAPRGQRHHVGDRPEYQPVLGQTNTLPMSYGFKALWDAIATPVPVERKGKALVAGVGPMNKIMSLKLPDYMGTQGKTRTDSSLDSLFRAVEFGTGIAENVGPDWVRKTGPTKAKPPHPPGSWWYRNRSQGEEQGGLFLGQKGFHFLYDARRQPHDWYMKRAKATFTRHLAKAIRNKLLQG